MADSNPYSTPTAPLVQPPSSGELATRGARFAAALIDGLIIVALLGPATFVTGYWGRIQAAALAGQSLILEPLLWGIAGFVVMVAIQAKPLTDSAQTWGKRVMKIQIVDLQGKPAAFMTIVTRRILPLQIVGLIPQVGGLVALVSILLIFGKDRRCAHDLIAGTKVVVAPGG